MKNIKSCSVLLLFLLILFPFLLMGCGRDDTGISQPKGEWYQSPNGLHVLIPDSLYTHDLYLPDRVITNPDEITDKLLSSVDTRTKEFCNNHEDFDCGKIRVNVRFILFDAFAFSCSRELSASGLCAGVFSENENTIFASIYGRWRGYGPPADFFSPPHTWLTVEQMEQITGEESPYDYTFYAGIGDILCPVIEFELGHYAYGLAYGGY